MSRTLLLLLFLFLSLSIPAVFSEPVLKVSDVPESLSTDQNFTYTLQVEWPKNEGTYSFALPDLPLDHLILINQAASQESFLMGEQAYTRKTFTYDLKPQEAGEGGIEAFSIAYIDSQNPSGAPGQLQAPSARIKVFKAKKPWNIYPLAAVLFAASAVTGFAVFSFLRKRDRAPKENAAAPKEKTLSEIQARIQSASAREDQALAGLHKEFREFLKEVYGAETSRGSESEMLEQLKAKNLFPDELRNIEKILNQMREAKYTGQRLDDMELQILKKEMNVLIESKRIQSSSN